MTRGISLYRSYPLLTMMGVAVSAEGLHRYSCMKNRPILHAEMLRREEEERARLSRATNSNFLKDVSAIAKAPQVTLVEEVSEHVEAMTGTETEEQEEQLSILPKMNIVHAFKNMIWGSDVATADRETIAETSETTIPTHASFLSKFIGSEKEEPTEEFEAETETAEAEGPLNISELAGTEVPTEEPQQMEMEDNASAVTDAPMKVLESVKEALFNAIEAPEEKADETEHKVPDNVLENVKETIVSAMDAPIDALEKVKENMAIVTEAPVHALENVKETFAAAMESRSDALEKVKENASVMTDAPIHALENVKETIVAAMDAPIEALEKVKENMAVVTETPAHALENVKETIVAAMESRTDALEKVRENTSVMTEAPVHALENVKETIASAMDAPIDVLEKVKENMAIVTEVPAHALENVKDTITAVLPTVEEVKELKEKIKEVLPIESAPIMAKEEKTSVLESIKDIFTHNQEEE